MNPSPKAGKPEKNQENWSKKYMHLRKLREDTYLLLEKRLLERTINILDASTDLQEMIEDASSGDTRGGSCYGAHMIMDEFYGLRLDYEDLPDTAATHIIV
jgi:hypothetical protein